MKQDEIRCRPPKEVMEWLQKLADKKGVSIHAIVREMIVQEHNTVMQFYVRNRIKSKP